MYSHAPENPVGWSTNTLTFIFIFVYIQLAYIFLELLIVDDGKMGGMLYIHEISIKHIHREAIELNYRSLNYKIL